MTKNQGTEISYSDGDVENEILNALKSSPDVSSAARIAPERHDNWAFEYHLSQKRANLVRHLNFKNKRVLEIGAGMGAISRFVSEQCEHLTVVEGTSRRLSCLRERLRDQKNFEIFCGNFADFQSPEKFDVVVVVGVLEYSEVYFPQGDSKSPFHAFVKKAQGHLAANGTLVLAIENRLGLKYWAGASEDHSGGFFDGVMGYGTKPSVRTFSKLELKTIMSESGFPNIEFQLPVPDYKLPTAVISEKADAHPAFLSNLLSYAEARDYSKVRRTLFSEALTFESLRGTGLLTEFANSYLVIANKSEVNHTAKDPSELAWVYSHSRTQNTATIFDQKQSEVFVRKSLQNLNQDHLNYGVIEWVRPPNQKIDLGTPLTAVLRRMLVFKEWDEFTIKWDQYFDWMKSSFGTTEGLIKGEAWDFIHQNIFIKGSAFQPIDEEWRLKKAFAFSWLIWRNIFSMDSMMKSNVVAKYGSLYELYQQTCARHGISPNFVDDMNSEIEVQSAITGNIPGEGYRRWLEAHFGYQKSNADHTAADLRATLMKTEGDFEVLPPLEKMAREVKMNEMKSYISQKEKQVSDLTRIIDSTMYMRTRRFLGKIKRHIKSY